MDLYLLFKFIHIGAAIIWIGGGVCLLVMAIIAERARNDADMLRILQSVVFLGNRMFVPAALLTLVFGGAMVYMSWRITDLWIMLALAGFLASFLLGTAVMKPMADRLSAQMATEGASPAVVAKARRLLQVAKFDYVILFSIVAVMVLKPSASDQVVLATLLVVNVLAASLTVLRMPPAAPVDAVAAAPADAPHLLG